MMEHGELGAAPAKGSRFTAFARALVVTALCALVPALLEHLALPSTDSPYASYDPLVGGDFPFHFAALQLTPILTALLIVELVAAAIPRWRARRHGGPRGRRPLVLAALIVAMVFATLQAYGVAQQARNLGELAGLGPTLAFVACLLLGLGLTLGAAWLASRFGVANGFVVLLVLMAIPTWLPHLLHTWGAEDREHAWHLILAGVGVTIVVLAWRPEGRRLPLAGLLPLTALTQVAALLVLLASFASPTLANAVAAPPDAVRTLLIALLALGLPWLALRRRPRTPWRAARRSLGASAVYIAVLVLLSDLAAPSRALPSVASDFVGIAMATAAVWDVLAELDARWRLGALVPAWAFQDGDAAERVAAALAARGVPSFVRSQRLHTLVRILGPWFPAELMVQPAALDLARELAAHDLAQPALLAAAEALA